MTRSCFLNLGVWMSYFHKGTGWRWDISPMPAGMLPLHTETSHHSRGIKLTMEATQQNCMISDFTCLKLLGQMISQIPFKALFISHWVLSSAASMSFGLDICREAVSVEWELVSVFLRWRAGKKYSASRECSLTT